MQFSDLLRARYSVRHFTDRPVAVEDLRAIVADAQRAPSWVNAQGWRVWIAVGEPLERIRAEYKKRTDAGIAGTPDFGNFPRTSWSAAAQRNMSVFSKAREDAGLAEAKETSQSYLFHAPAVAYLTMTNPENHWATLDLGGFEQTLLLAAADRGIGSVPAYNLVKYPDVLRTELAIPDEEKIAIGIALGYAADVPLNAFHSTRVPTDEILTIVG
ncbi:nitroreductase [Sutterella sp.]|uniref:nitroreductase n=1 Tax=Sutterella sp. TaxID=1981025 RepID=UPI0026DF8D08|nr:nitroreductase [Sutterella sp.]MDO5531490.1 nitroreductase [Sutterella sp.]